VGEHNDNREPLLDSTEAAALLKINPFTLQRMARTGEVPGIKVGKLWRYRKSDLDEWLASKVSSFRHPCRK
jgi:excisionase family DNA binding protein